MRIPRTKTGTTPGGRPYTSTVHPSGAKFTEVGGFNKPFYKSTNLPMGVGKKTGINAPGKVVKSTISKPTEKKPMGAKRSIPKGPTQAFKPPKVGPKTTTSKIGAPSSSSAPATVNRGITGKISNSFNRLQGAAMNSIGKPGSLKPMKNKNPL